MRAAPKKGGWGKPRRIGTEGKRKRRLVIRKCLYCGNKAIFDAFERPGKCVCQL